MFKYEITFILAEAETNEPVSKVVQAAGGKVISSRDLGVKAFSYPIAKATIGRYFSVLFEIMPEDLKKLEKPLKLERSILRYLLVKAIRAHAPRPPKPERKEKASDQKIEKIEEKAAAPMVEKVEEVKAQVKPMPTGRQAVKKPAAKIKAPKPKAEKVAKPVKEPVAKKEPAKVPEIEKDLLDEKLKDLVSE